MKFRQLEAFLRVAELGNLSKAANALGRTQPILSKNIKDLETHLGAELFYRTGRGLSLTDAGQRFFVRATHIVEEMRQAELDIRSLGHNQLTHATIAFPTIMVSMLVDPLARAIREHHPHIQLRLREATGGPILGWVVNRQVDIAILYDTMPLQADAMQTLYKEKLYLVGRPNLKPLNPTTDIRELSDIPLVLPGPNESLRTLLEMLAAQQGIKLNIVIEGDAYRTLRVLIDKGHGYGILPRSSILTELRSGTLQASRLTNPEVERSIVLTTCSNRIPASGLKSLVDIIKKVVRETIEAANSVSISNSIPSAPKRRR